jgi:hypothetical protein
MKKEDVIIGRVYAMKVSGKLSPVEIKGTSTYTGWIGVNLRTEHTVLIHSARKLQFELEKNPTTGKWREKASQVKDVVQ